jgi:hypothetical protein
MPRCKERMWKLCVLRYGVHLSSLVIHATAQPSRYDPGHGLRYRSWLPAGTRTLPLATALNRPAQWVPGLLCRVKADRNLPDFTTLTTPDYLCKSPTTSFIRSHITISTLFSVICNLWRWLSSWMLCPDDGGSKHLWNVGQFLPDYAAQQPRRQSSSFSLPWEPETSSAICVLTAK